jgi:hypothetical protein
VDAVKILTKEPAMNQMTMNANGRKVEKITEENIGNSFAMF